MLTLFSSIRLACVKLLSLLHSFNIFVMAPLKKPRTFIPLVSCFYFSGSFCLLFAFNFKLWRKTLLLSLKLSTTLGLRA